ncbi:hypothetical protein ACOMHN_015539 [Nucella lapillus]
MMSRNEDELKTACEGCYTSRVKGAAPSEGPASILGMGCSTWDIDVPMEAERTARCGTQRRARQHPRDGMLILGHRCPPWRQNELLGASRFGCRGRSMVQPGTFGLTHQFSTSESGEALLLVTRCLPS